MVVPMKRDRSDGDPPALWTALAMLDKGLWPVPITPIDDPKARSPGKQPIGPEWGLVRHTPDTLRGVWADQPGAGVGVKLGKEGGVIDVEVDDPEHGPATLADLFGGEMVETLGWSSTRGSHYLFRWDDRLARYGRTIVKVGGVEIRIGSAEPGGGKQLQSVVPPSPGSDGKPRAWNGHKEIADLPDSVFDYLDRLRAEQERPKPRATIPIYQPKPGEWGPAERARACVLSLKFPDSIEHQRGHDRLYNVACVLVDSFGLTYYEAMPIFREYNAAKAHPPESDAQLEHKLSDAIKNHPSPSRSALLADRDPKSRSTTKTTKGTKAPQNGGNVPYVVNVVGSQNGDGGGPDPESMEVRAWPAALTAEAYQGLAGEIVRALAPHTESDPAAILVQLLVGFGNIVGRTAHFVVEADQHFPNLFACLVGPSSKARKGSSWGQVRRILAGVDPEWARTRVLSGLSSGEGLIWAVRDPIVKHEAVKEKGRVVDYQDVEVDAGVADKRILCLEPELASPLKVLAREGNTLSALIRRAWDDGNLRTLTKNNPAVATDAHVSLIGHITKEELERLLSDTEAANGFGNRFLWICVRRCRSLPFGGMAHRIDFTTYYNRLEHAAMIARGRGEIGRDGYADQLWMQVYDRMAEGRPGLLGAILGRAEAQVMRLALIYALLDGSAAIGRPHLEAALALWRYAEDSAGYAFGASLGDPLAYTILDALKAAPAGLTQTQICHEVCDGNRTREEISRALSRLTEAGRAYSERGEATGGRPATRWFSTYDLNDGNDISPQNGT